MRRISSCTTLLQKGLGLLLAFGFLIAADASRVDGQLPCFLFLLGAIAVGVVWWMFMRPASEVFIDDNNLYFIRHGIRVVVPLRKVVDVRPPSWVKNPPLVVTFEEDDGSRGRFVFIPSITQNGGLFGP